MRGRFAPSPTGRLHLGNARTAFLAWLQVRAAGGRFLLRIEDLDRARCRANYLDDIFRDLEYLGLTWDEEPIFQSRRGEAYESALDRLRQLGRIYECFCSRSEIERAASAPHGAADDGPRYPGTCSNLEPQAAADRRRRRAPALRFRTFDGRIELTDRFSGCYEQDVSAAGAASYSAWWEIIPGPSIGLAMTVAPGDHMHASIAELVPSTNTWAVRAAEPHEPRVLGRDGERP